MIDINHNYALLEDGTIEPLWYDEEHTERRDVHHVGPDRFYLDHDRWSGNIQTLYSHKIVRTANTIEELQEGYQKSGYDDEPCEQCKKCKYCIYREDLR